MMLSIVTVCFNAENMIQKTINSVLAQTSTNFEYIFIDGMSTDTTMKIINQNKSLFEKRGIPVTVISEKDNGIYDAMNKATRIAQGEWINFLNAGDIYHDDTVVRNMERELCDETRDIVVGKIVYIEGYLGRTYYHEALENIKKRMIFCHQAIFARVELFKVKSFDTSYKYSADYDWILKLYLDGREIKLIDLIVAYYDSTGASNQNRDRTLSEVETIRSKKGLIEKEPITESNISLKYKIYRTISKNFVLAKIYYWLYKNKNEDVHWIERR